MFQWQVIYPDGRYLTNAEIGWDEISTATEVDGMTLHLLNDEVASLSGFAGLKEHRLRSPGPGVKFYRYYQGRTSLRDGSLQMMYHVIGYLAHFGRIQLEIDPAGNTALRAYPLTSYAP